MLFTPFQLQNNVVNINPRSDPVRTITRDPQPFASFMGYFGQMTNTISFVFSLFGTGHVIKTFGLTNVMISYPVLLLVCALIVWIYPSLWVVFSVMMVLKGMSYALNNPCKEILYQVPVFIVK